MDEQNDIAHMLALLHSLRGTDFVRQLKLIAVRHEFSALSTDPQIFTTRGERSADYDNLLNAARKAVEHGYKVYVLPNPKGFRTADFIFERKGVFKMYDLKTVSGSNSLGTRLTESVGQTNRVLLNIRSDYNPIALARHVKKYFETNRDAIEVLIYKGRKSISVLREDALSKEFFKYFIAKYIK